MVMELVEVVEHLVEWVGREVEGRVLGWVEAKGKGRWLGFGGNQSSLGNCLWDSYYCYVSASICEGLLVS